MDKTFLRDFRYESFGPGHTRRVEWPKIVDGGARPEQLHASPLHRLARTLTSWLEEPIVAMWRFSRSNSITEGFHAKMEMMSRRACGFRNFENYRLRVLTHRGWDGIINRV